uniref:BSD domain-containing protein n=1 Tax=Timema shepardi TaxID=629360 RepID=A0A7R9AML7_TIMSH|nr:unnamed protein product [Timema shepardi]
MVRSCDNKNENNISKCSRNGRDGGWWGSWYKAAKDKSTEVLQFVKRDLDEFSTAVKSEVSNVVNTTTSALKDKLKLDEPESTASNVKRSMSTFFDTVSNVLSPSPEDDDQEAIVIFDSQPVVMTKLQAKHHALVLDPDTYLKDPEESVSKQYEAWLGILEDQITPERLTRLMTANPDLHMQYSRLVPELVSHTLFWQRYLFRKALLEDDEARQEAMERRAEREKQAASNFRWDKDLDFASNIDLTEEEQIKLLAEYEKECADKKLKGEVDDPLLGMDLQDNHYSSGMDVRMVKSQSEPVMTKPSPPSPGELKVREKRDMVIIGDGSSCQTSSSGDKESNDEDWEREFDLEDEPEAELTTANKSSSMIELKP